MASALHLDLSDDSDPDQIVTGYHGTVADRASEIVATQRIEPSNNGYDWLGDGAYFWERSPLRASEWAERKGARDQVSVIKAKIRLGVCLDLVDSRYRGVVQEAQRRFQAREIAAGRTAPVNKGKLARLDCAVFNYLCEILDKPIDTIREVYAEGEPTYTGAALYGQSHIHLCVRNPACILTLSIFDGPLAFPISEVVPT